MTNTELTRTRADSWRAVVEAYQVCSQRYGSALNHVDLTPAQFEVMILIRSLKQNATPKRIAERLLVTKGNITGVTNRLLTRGLIDRRSHQTDGRSLVFELTSRGQKLLLEANKVAAEFVRQQLEPFTDEEVEIVGRLMRQMKQHLLLMDADSIAKAALE